MTKAEILSQIKKAEEDARTMISEANEAKARKILEAKGKAREIVSSAEKESIKSKELKINQAKEKIVSEKEKMLKEGFNVAESIKEMSKGNIDKATKFLVEEFERTVHA